MYGTESGSGDFSPTKSLLAQKSLFFDINHIFFNNKNISISQTVGGTEVATSKEV